MDRDWLGYYRLLILLSPLRPNEGHVLEMKQLIDMPDSMFL